MNKLLIFFVFFLMLCFKMSFAQDIYNFSSKKQEVQFNHLLKEIRCLVCQNQDIQDSNSGFAKDLKREVYKLIISGKSDHEIVNYLSERFGDYILFNPPLKLLTLLLWTGPFLFSFLGLLVFWQLCLRKDNGN